MKQAKIYKNPHVRDRRRTLLAAFLWMIGYYREEVHPKAPGHYTYPVKSGLCDLQKPWALWVNHSSYLLSVQGRHFLTDPIWSRRCSPLPFLGPSRHHAPGISFEELPKIDYVLISHDHYDHLDLPSVQKLHKRFPEIIWFVPQGVGAWLKRQKIFRIVEMSWGETSEIAPGFRITSVPAQHFSGRWTLNSTLWCGYVIEALEAVKTFYFVGDTGYNPHDFKNIGAKWPSIDLSLIPIGCYSPRKFMNAVHVEPREAALIHKEVGSKLSLAMHWKTFALGDEPMHQPPFDLYRALLELGVHPESFLAVEPGKRVNW